MGEVRENEPKKINGSVRPSRTDRHVLQEGPEKSEWGSRDKTPDRAPYLRTDTRLNKAKTTKRKEVRKTKSFLEREDQM